MKYSLLLLVLFSAILECAEPPVSAKDKFFHAMDGSQSLARRIHQREETVKTLQEEIRSLKETHMKQTTDLLNLCKQVPAAELRGPLGDLKREWEQANLRVKEAEIELTGFFPYPSIDFVIQKFTIGGITYTARNAFQKKYKAEAERTQIEKQMSEMLSKH